MKSSLLLIIPALLVTLFSSCKKDDGSHNTVTPGGYRSLDEAMESTAPLPKKTKMSVSSGDTLFGYAGTKFVIPPNVFETLDGKKVTGSVDITIQDWLFKGDMIFGKVLPLSYGAITQSGGEAFVQVSQNDQILRIRKDTFITVMFPQFNSGFSSLNPWIGRTMTGSANTVNWLAAGPTQLNVYTLNADTIYVRADTMHYIGVANTLSPGNFVNFTVRVDSAVLEQSKAYLMYDKINAMFPLPSATNGRIQAVNVPTIGAPVHIAVMGINKGQFFGGTLAVDDPRSDSTYIVNMKAMEPPTLRLKMNNL